VVLTDDRTVARWANVADAEPIRARPDERAPRIARLHWYTEDGFPEVYLLLRRHRDAQGTDWIQLRIPMRPNGRTGWVHGDALGPMHKSRSLLVIARRQLRITLYRRGRRVWSAPVGIGKAGTPTPAGLFWVRERFRVLDSNSPYAPFAFGTSNYSTLTDWPGGGVVGIHGDWQQPWLIPGRPSHGCVRLRRPDDVWLAHHIATGTPLHII
jgi:L,D-transpeptidase catalytic domain